jgi:hypothetical protein
VETVFLREEIDDAIFDLFEIRASRAEVRRFYRTAGRVEAGVVLTDLAEFYETHPEAVILEVRGYDSQADPRHAARPCCPDRSVGFALDLPATAAVVALQLV